MKGREQALREVDTIEFLRKEDNVIVLRGRLGQRLKRRIEEM